MSQFVNSWYHDCVNTNPRAVAGKMRIRILQVPRLACIDGIRLDQFVDGLQYEVGNTLGALFLCEGWAEPVDDPSPALVIPLRGFPVDYPRPRPTPPSLTRETYPSSLEARRATARDRRRRRHRSN